MDFFETVTNRHSYRGPFTDATIDKDALCKIVQAGLVLHVDHVLSPCGSNARNISGWIRYSGFLKTFFP